MNSIRGRDRDGRFPFYSDCASIIVLCFRFDGRRSIARGRSPPAHRVVRDNRRGRSGSGKIFLVLCRGLEQQGGKLLGRDNVDQVRRVVPFVLLRGPFCVDVTPHVAGLSVNEPDGLFGPWVAESFVHPRNRNALTSRHMFHCRVASSLADLYHSCVILMEGGSKATG